MKLGAYGNPARSDYATSPWAIPIVGGLVALTALGAVSIGAFFTVPALSAIPPALTFTPIVITEGGVVVGEVTYVLSEGVALTAPEMVTLAQMSAGELSLLSNEAIAAVLESWGFHTLLSVDSLLVLAAYDITAQNPNYGGEHHFLTPYPIHTGPGPGGGTGTPPGFPGSGFPGGPPGSVWGCITVDGETVCRLYY